MRFRKMTLLPLVLSASVTLAARAQQKECSIDENKFAKDVFGLQRVRGAKTPDDAAKQLKSIVGDLTSKNDNPVERNYVLGQALALWIAQPNVGTVVKRAEVGYASNPEATIDLAAAVDTAFTAVEAAKPECAKQISGPSGVRRNEGWVKLANAAVQAINADQVDSAAVFAQRSLLLYKSPIAYNVLANVAQKRGNTREAIDQFNLFVSSSEGDTTLTDNRRQALLVIGNIATDAAQSAQGAEKDAYIKDARAAYQELSADKDSHYTDLAQQGIARLALAVGDTATLKSTYQPQLANPGAYNYVQLIGAAVSAAQANQTADATKLFLAAYQLNPNHRDVLANLAIMYIKDNQYSQALPYIDRLVKVDPSNGENYRLYAFSYAGMQKRLMTLNKEYGVKANAAKGAKLKAAYIDSARISNDSIRAITDLALKFNTMADSLPVKVTFTEFTPKDGNASLGGTITNNGDAAKSYTLKVEFLDKSGNVVATQETNVGPVAPKGTSKFNVTGTGAGIIAFRYAPLT